MTAASFHAGTITATPGGTSGSAGFDRRNRCNPASTDWYAPEATGTAPASTKTVRTHSRGRTRPALGVQLVQHRQTVVIPADRVTPVTVGAEQQRHAEVDERSKRPRRRTAPALVDLDPGAVALRGGGEALDQPQRNVALV